MIRHVVSDQLGDFASIYDEDVEVVSVTRPLASECEALSSQLVCSRQLASMQWVQAVENRKAALSGGLPHSVDNDASSALAGEIREAIALMSRLMGCSHVGVRLESLRAPMCPRFHADHVLCRMLITLSGAGTEWIPHADVDWHVFADRNATHPPLRSNAKVQQLATGSWSLLKGGKWNEDFDGVVHRSPDVPGGRLLLALDPVFGGAEKMPGRARAFHPSAVS